MLHPLVTGHGTLAQLPALLADQSLSGTAFVVSDDRVLPLWGGRVREVLEDAGWRVAMRAIPAGEASKSVACASALWDWLAEERAERTDTVIALGGGVVGDLAGFVAATYLRGLHLVQLPTTLLAQVDSAIGGKTGIDHPRAKNLIGAFYPQRLTLIDIDFLDTLPERELRGGFAEVVKTALVVDADLFGFLLEHADALLRRDPEPLAHAVGRCARLKLEVVTEDPDERGRRAILNYGHTAGHALEAEAGYGALPHGEAVAVGMRVAARVGCRLGITAPELAEAQVEALARFGLPRSASGLDAERVLERMRLDKKVRGGRVRWVLLRDAARPELIDDVPREVVSWALEGCLR